MSLSGQEIRSPAVASMGLSSSRESNNRYYSLDFWRGLACLMVVLFHSSFYVNADIQTWNWKESPIGTSILYLISLMWIGVPVFFVISGYCITATVHSDLRYGRSVKDYFRRRLRRIYPPFWAYVLLITTASAVLLACGKDVFFTEENHPLVPPDNLATSQWFGNFLLIETWREDWFGAESRCLVMHMWTLCYEEQFYAVMGLLLLVAPRRIFAGAFIISNLVLGCVLLSVVKQKWMFDWYFFDGRWLLFAMGILLFYQANCASRTMKPFLSLLFVGGAILGLLLKRAQIPEMSHFLGRELIIGSLFALGLMLIRPWDRDIHGSRFLQPVTWCGSMCYSLYLLHWPMTKLVSHYFYYSLGIRDSWGTILMVLPVALGASILAAWIFHHAVEKHFMNSARNPVEIQLPRLEFPQNASPGSESASFEVPKGFHALSNRRQP